MQLCICEVPWIEHMNYPVSPRGSDEGRQRDVHVYVHVLSYSKFGAF